MPATPRASLRAITLIGPGNWGISLAHALHAAGLPLREIVGKRARLPRDPGLCVVPWHRARLSADIFWLCVPDREIEGVAAALAARRDLHGKLVVHSSGALTVDALEPARRAGAPVAAVHPVMTFPSRRPVPLAGVRFGIEGGSAATRRTLQGIVRRIGGKPFAIASAGKSLYHAAGTLASPLLVSALTAAIETALAAGLAPCDAAGVVQALAEATLRNVFTRGPQNSFSGPFARGDASTVKLHLQALHGHPILADVYRSLARLAIASLPVRNPRELTRVVEEAGRSSTRQRAGSAGKLQKRMRDLKAGS